MGIKARLFQTVPSLPHGPSPSEQGLATPPGCDAHSANCPAKHFIIRGGHSAILDSMLPPTLHNFEKRNYTQQEYPRRERGGGGEMGR